MIEIEYKQKIREYFEIHLSKRRREGMVYGFPTGIILRENDVEKFIDDLWVHINKTNAK